MRLGQPFQVTVRTTPYTAHERLVADLGVYVQDTWTVKRMTVNAGLRWDYLNNKVARAGCAGRHVDWPAAFRRADQCAEVHRSVAAARPGLRPVRQRQDRGQGDVEPLRADVDGRLPRGCSTRSTPRSTTRRGRGPPTPTATASRSSPSWARLALDGVFRHRGRGRAAAEPRAPLAAHALALAGRRPGAGVVPAQHRVAGPARVPDPGGPAQRARAPARTSSRARWTSSASRC